VECGIPKLVHLRHIFWGESCTVKNEAFEVVLQILKNIDEKKLEGDYV